MDLEIYLYRNAPKGKRYHLGSAILLSTNKLIVVSCICPSGWHIPSDEEFTELTDFLGGEIVAGYAMKDDVFMNGSNSSGWSGLPCGYRYSGGFNVNGDFGYWWSASESDSGSWARRLGYYYDDVVRYVSIRNDGFSARCVRD